MKMHIEYDDFGWYVEANDEGTLYAVGAAEDTGDQGLPSAAQMCII